MAVDLRVLNLVQLNVPFITWPEDDEVWALPAVVAERVIVHQMIDKPQLET